MVNLAASLPRHAPSTAAATSSSSPASDLAHHELVRHFAERMRLVDTDSRQGAQITAWLRGIGERLLAADGTKLAHAVSYHLSDSKEPEAFVHLHEGSARIVISKGLFSLIKNEDQLATILAHELMHVRFKEHFGTESGQIATTKVEEYIADVAACATWVIKAGYAPRESVAVFDALKEHAGKDMRVLRPWVAYSDVHGLLENRAQAISGLIAKELTEKGSVPVDITPFSGETKMALKGARHVTYFEKLKGDPSYANATIEERYKRLIDEVKAISRATSGRLGECLTEFRETLKELPVTSLVIEEIYGALKENKLSGKTKILEEAYRASSKQGNKPLPPAEIRQMAQEIKSFVSSTSDQQLLASARKISAFAREWANGDPVLRAAIKGSFDVRDIDSETPPWDRHINLARSAAGRGDSAMIEALWALGAYDARALSFAPDAVLASFRDRPQLTACKNAENYVIDPAGEWRANPMRSLQRDPLLVARESYGELVDAEINARGHKRSLSNGTITHDRRRFANLASVPLENFAGDVTGIINLFADEIVHPAKVQFYSGSPVMRNALKERMQEDEDLSHEENSPEQVDESLSLQISEDLEGHYKQATELAKIFDAMLSHPDPAIRRDASAGIRAFYLNSEGPCFETLVGRFPLDGISTEKGCKHPLVTFVATCTALSAKERVDFLRGLEHQLSPVMWNKAYFTGYELTTNREKLRHLQSVAPHQESALRAGASLIAQEFEKAPVAPTSVIPFLAEHKGFFPALRNLDDDVRQAILDQIESVTIWEAPLTDLIDSFWALEQAKLFPPAETGVRELLRTKIISGIQAILDPEERKGLAERSLLSPVSETQRISEVGMPSETGASSHDAASKRQEMLNQSSALLSLKDPVVRSAVTGIWAESVRELVSRDISGTAQGRDDGSAQYISATKPHLARIVSTIRRRLPVQERRELLGVLADTLELQDTLALYLRDSITEHSRATVADAHEYFRSAEAGFEFINQDAWRRDAVVRFLSQPFTPRNLEEFARRVDISRNREISALTETVEGILVRHEKQLADTQTRMQAIGRMTDERGWVGRLFHQASTDLLEYLDKVDGADYPTDDLAESLENIMPEAIADDTRKKLLAPLTDLDDFVSPARATELLRCHAAECKAALQAAIDSEKAMFDAVLEQGSVEVKALNPAAAQPELDRVRRALLTRLANLPEYEFVSALEDRISAARTQAALDSVITKSREGLSKSFERERRREESRFDKEVAKLTRESDQKQARIDKLIKERPPFLRGFHAELCSVLTTFGDLLPRSKFPHLYRVMETPLEELSSSFDENDEASVSAELEVALEHLQLAQEDLVERHRALEGRVQQLSEMEDRVSREAGTLKRTPIPVSTVIEEAAQPLGAGGMGEYGEEGLSFVEDVLREFDREYPRVRRESKLAVTPLEEQHARQFYELFWSQSAEVRAVALKLLLIPPEAEYQDRKSGTHDHFYKAFDFVAEQIFPEGMRYGADSKKILKIFLEETDPSLRGFMLAALMAASEKVAGAPEEYSAGKRLAMILSMLGPAEKKLGQAINSHPLTPEDLRSDTKSIKSMSDPLPRWDLLERIAEAVPESYRDAALPRIGSTLGAASYYIAVDCDDSVLSILRPHARELARTGLDRMEAIAIRLSNDPELKHVAGPFVESIQQAREMIALETDHEKGVVQQVNAWKRYEGLSIGVDDDTFSFNTAAWKGCGPEFRHQQKVDGEHFLDIFERDGAQDPFTRKAALAHITAELVNILSGERFDHDRHGSQSKIVRGNGTHTIGLFDHGCMALTAPTDAEKRQLATVLCDLVEGYLQGKTGLLERAHSIIRERREHDGVAPAYLVSVERALLALNDFMRFDSTGESTLLKRSDLGGAIAAVFRSGEVDPVFSSTIAERFAGPGASMFLRFLSPSQLAIKIAEKIEEQLKGAPSISISRGKGTEMPEPIVFAGKSVAA